VARLQIVKPTRAGDAEITKADEAYEANETNEADEADLADEATDATETTEADEADVANKPDDADEAEANEADKAEANEADNAIVADEIVTANDATADKLPIDNEHVIDSVIVYFSFGWQPFSLTKYCAIISKDKGYFCPIANNNQFGIGSGILCFWVASEFES
jgi:hypothetical protein